MLGHEALLLELFVGTESDVSLLHGQERDKDIDEILFNQMTVLKTAT